MSHQHSRLRRNKLLSLPPRLAAELATLGHTVKPASSSRWKAKQRKASGPAGQPATQSKSDGKKPVDGRSRSADRHGRDSRPSLPTTSNPSHDSAHPESQRKKRKLNDQSRAPSRQPTHPEQKPKTALEKLLKTQTAGTTMQDELPKRKTKSKSQEEILEDKQIAWLEAELGLKNGKNSKIKLRQEFEEDGLEDLFDGLDELDQLVENLTTVPGAVDSGLDFQEGFGPDNEAQDTNEMEDMLDDASAADIASESESSWSGCHVEDDVEENVTHVEKSAPDPLGLSTQARQEGTQTTLASLPHTSARYIPPHLRAQSPKPATRSEKPEEPVLDTRLRRQMMGILNRVSPTSLPVCLDSLRDLYTSHPRAVITHGLGDIILELISSKEQLGAALLVTYAALVSAITRGGVQVSGVEIGWAASFIADLAVRICNLYESNVPKQPTQSDEVGKSGVNLLAFLSQLYFFQVVSCTLVYDLVRLLIEEGLDESRVEGLIVLLKASGPRLRHDDPAALKGIVSIVQSKRKDMGDTNSRTKFMLETLTDLKNNKIRKDPQSIAGTTDELQENLKKYLGGLSKKSSSEPEPMQFTLKDLKEANKKGKWWLIGAGWEGNPLVDGNLQGSRDQQLAEARHKHQTDATMMNLARKQGMNTDVRRSIFNAIMTGEDYVDACEKVNQLGLSSIQQREIIRVLLHCLGKEVLYNPYYTMVGQKLAADSHSIKITMQFLLWDFFRELGETEVGGQEMLKSLSGDQADCEVDKKRMDHMAWAYGWWIAKGSLSITVLKPLPFGCLRPATIEFLSKLLTLIFISTQASSPTLAPSTMSFKRDPAALHNVFQKALGAPRLATGLAVFLDAMSGEAFRSPIQLNGAKVGLLSSQSTAELVEWSQKSVVELLSNVI